MADDLEKGDHVTWKSHGSTDTEASGRQVGASEDDPQYEVKSGKSGRTAVHKPSALDEA